MQGKESIQVGPGKFYYPCLLVHLLFGHFRSGAICSCCVELSNFVFVKYFVGSWILWITYWLLFNFIKTQFTFWLKWSSWFQFHRMWQFLIKTLIAQNCDLNYSHFPLLTINIGTCWYARSAPMIDIDAPGPFANRYLQMPLRFRKSSYPYMVGVRYTIRYKVILINSAVLSIFFYFQCSCQ